MVSYFNAVITKSPPSRRSGLKFNRSTIIKHLCYVSALAAEWIEMVVSEPGALETYGLRPRGGVD